MARSHPPTLLTLVRRALERECELESGARVLVAVSGGPDSMALLHALSCLRSRFGFELAAHGVDHGLRPEAALELALAERLARDLGVAFSCTTLALSAGGNLQARAREARYRALKTQARSLGGALIATAHHADDRAETVLLRLLRGAGPPGLAVLPARDGARIRPLIRARRADVLLHLERHEVPFAEDPSNQDARFLRVRVRTELMPLLKALSPKIVEHLTALADEIERPRPAFVAPGGEPLVLGRAQHAMVEALLRDGSRSGRVPLRGGWELSVDPGTGTLRLGAAARRERGAAARPRRTNPDGP